MVDYDIRSGKRILAATVACPQLARCALSTDGSLFATVSEEGVVRVYSDSKKVTASADPPVAATIRFRVMVEAGGVEPPSEKARHEETTCVSGSKVSATASEPARAAAA